MTGERSTRDGASPPGRPVAPDELDRLRAENRRLRELAATRDENRDLHLAHARKTQQWKDELWELREARWTRATGGWMPPLVPLLPFGLGVLLSVAIAAPLGVAILVID